MHTSALVLFSGGQDSTTCLAHALQRYERVETIAFDYRRRHSVELDARLVVLSQLREQFPQWAPKLGEDHLLDLAVLGSVTALGIGTSFAKQLLFPLVGAQGTTALRGGFSALLGPGLAYSPIAG